MKLNSCADSDEYQQLCRESYELTKYSLQDVSREELQLFCETDLKTLIVEAAQKKVKSMEGDDSDEKREIMNRNLEWLLKHVAEEHGGDGGSVDQV